MLSPDIAEKLQCVDDNKPNRLNRFVYPIFADSDLHPPSDVTHRKLYSSSVLLLIFVVESEATIIVKRIIQLPSTFATRRNLFSEARMHTMIF